MVRRRLCKVTIWKFKCVNQLTQLHRNLEKLAAMVNKFLKGLADATGFSFSLLAGGPSPELSGLIDVYRQVNHADLWNPALTFGIKFSCR